MPSKIFKGSIEVPDRLADLGTSREMLLEVVDAMVAAKAECTDNDPYGSRGWRGWQMGSRRLRETHVGIDDWKKDDKDQVPSIISVSHGVRIVVCNTDDGTAIEALKPQNNSKKGAATDRAVDGNQLSFMSDLDATSVVPFSRKALQESIVTYFLCVYSDSDDRRAELSCPVSNESGYFEEFKERIFIVGGDTDTTGPTRRKLDGDGDSEYPIPVVRKK